MVCFRVMKLLFKRLAAFLCAGGASLWPSGGAAARAAELEGGARVESYLAETIRELSLAWPKNRTIHIVCHGHSVPAGYFKTPVVDSLNAYPHLLFEGLKRRHPNAVVNVVVTAIGGEDSAQGAERFEREVLAFSPAVALIDYGLNDRRIGLEAAEAAWRRMVELAKAKGVKTLLLTPTGDTSARMESPDDPLNQHAAQIRRLAVELEVGLVDSLAATQAYLSGGGRLEELMSQSNHPNRRGHELVAKEALKWFDAAPRNPLPESK